MTPDIDHLLSSDFRKPTALVHFERDMTLTEQKVMTLIVFHCQVAEKDENGLYHIRKSFVRRFLGWEDSNNYQRIYDAFEDIFNNTIKWNLLGKDKTVKSLKCKLIVSLLEPTETGPFIGFQLHPKLEPLIKDPRLFARIKLIMMAILAKPKYAFPLYEILTDCYSRGEKTLRLSIAELKESLGIDGPYYDQFIAFKKEVLKPNLAAVNQNTDCQVSYEAYREGRRVAGVVFTIDKQPWNPPLLQEHLRELQRYYQDPPVTLPLLDKTTGVNAEEQAFLDSVKPYQIAEADALQVLETHGLEGAMEIRDYVLAEIARRRGTAEEIRNIGAYLARCFREGYGRKTAEERAADRRRRHAPAIAQAQQQAQEQQRAAMDALLKTFRQQQAAQVEARLAAMTGQEREAFNQAFTQANPIWAKSYRESGLTSPMLRAAFQTFAIPRLLTAEQQDLTGYAHAQGASLEILNLLQLSA